ncbi:hypothetical protein L9F63_022282 [Diploptera punctata]|uniref:F-box domain-containing protein n=1 Tax=Diploptera punctata TaxID=6984 RepID=A0AAD8EAJ1_DIPPU|nr:hypothetical protein L9F63_022282 [Diploptera punctata]
MNLHPPLVCFNRSESTMDDLPDEVLEYILSLVAPYKDLQECSLVCKRWHQNVIRHAQKNLNRAISDFNICWEKITPEEMAPTITKRYSHSACRYGNSMYVFGGCTSASTTFNDLWRLDLNKRQWVRPLTMGTYPSPKACASIVCYKRALILFGGWTHPSPYPLHQAWRLFNELHVYGIISNRWTCINTPITPPAMAGHSATIQGDLMVVFGGLQRTNPLGHYGSSSDVWCFNLEIQVWNKQITTETKPHSRYGQSQIALDDSNILILGGCGGPNMVFSDVWLLSMTEPVWTWKEVNVRNSQWGATHMWCHPACKIGQRVVIFSRNPVSSAPTFTYSAKWNTPSQLQNNISNVWVPPRERDIPSEVLNRRASEGLVEPRSVDRDSNINGRRGVLSPRSLSVGNVQNAGASTSSSSGEDSDSEMAGPSSAQPSPEHQTPPQEHVKVSQLNCSPKQPLISFNEPENAGPSGLGMAAFRDPSPVFKPNATKNRQRQLESLRRMEERIRNLSRNGSGSSASPEANNNVNIKTNGSTSNNLQHSSRSGTASNSSPCSSPAKTSTTKNAMTMFVLDISHVLSNDCYVEWLPVKSNNIFNGEPKEKILYTLIAGKGELIMFGGIQKDATSITPQAQLSSDVPNTVSNSLHFITAPKGII